MVARSDWVPEVIDTDEGEVFVDPEGEAVWSSEAAFLADDRSRGRGRGGELEAKREDREVVCLVSGRASSNGWTGI